jgi:VIT1/CCC1 family predicted Fe2+/Mn2+ transporter
MKKDINQKLKWNIMFSFLILLLGAILLIYMIIVEDEPGALPMVLILTGMVFLIINWLKFKRNSSTNKL